MNSTPWYKTISRDHFAAEVKPITRAEEAIAHSPAEAPTPSPAKAPLSAPSCAPAVKASEAADADTEPRDIDLALLTERLQVRVRTVPAIVAKYAELLAGGTKLPLPVVFELPNGALVVADGNHTVDSHEKLLRRTVTCRILRGSRLDALAYAARSNAQHGLPLTNDDKRNALRLFFAEPDANSMSDLQIAKSCGVSDHFVGNMRRELGANAEARVTKTGRVINTSSIGARAPRRTPNGSESSASTESATPAARPSGEPADSPGRPTAPQAIAPAAGTPPVQTTTAGTPAVPVVVTAPPSPVVPSSESLPGAPSDQATDEKLLSLCIVGLDGLRKRHPEIPPNILATMVHEHGKHALGLKGGRPIKVGDLEEQAAVASRILHAHTYLVQQRREDEPMRVEVVRALDRSRRLSQSEADAADALVRTVAEEVGDPYPFGPIRTFFEANPELFRDDDESAASTTLPEPTAKSPTSQASEAEHDVRDEGGARAARDVHDDRDAALDGVPAPVRQLFDKGLLEREDVVRFLTMAARHPDHPDILGILASAETIISKVGNRTLGIAARRRLASTVAPAFQLQVEATIGVLEGWDTVAAG